MLRLRNKGLPDFQSEERGDLYVALRLRVPTDLAPDDRALWERLRKREPAPE